MGFDNGKLVRVVVSASFGGGPDKHVNVLHYDLDDGDPITIPNDQLAPGPCTLTVEVCDCTECEAVGGQGRCVTLAIPVLYQPTGEPSASTGRPGQK